MWVFDRSGMWVSPVIWDPITRMSCTTYMFFALRITVHLRWESVGYRVDSLHRWPITWSCCLACQLFDTPWRLCDVIVMKHTYIYKWKWHHWVRLWLVTCAQIFKFSRKTHIYNFESISFYPHEVLVRTLVCCNLAHYQGLLIHEICVGLPIACIIDEVPMNPLYWFPRRRLVSFTKIYQWHGNIFGITGLLWEQSSGHRWILLT